MSHTMFLHRWTVLWPHFLANVFAGYSWTKPNTASELHPKQPQLKDLIYKCLDLQPLEWVPKASPSLSWLNMLLILAWMVFVDSNKTITVNEAFIECVSQPLWQMLCMECLLLPHYSALLTTDFRSENERSEEGSSLPQVPGHSLQKRTLHGVFACLSDTPAFFSQAWASDLQSTFTGEHPLCSDFCFSFHVLWCKERENNSSQYF